MPKKKTKKKTTRKNNKPSLLLKLLRVFLWITPGLLLGLFLPWYLYLDNLIENKFIQHENLIPSTVYSRPLSLFKGQSLTSKQLLFELERLGYSSIQTPTKLAEYSNIGDSFEIVTKGFNFPEGFEKPQRVSLSIEENQINSISPDYVRLEPSIIGQLFSQQLKSHKPISIQQIPEIMVKGLQAVEDRTFKHHSGVDYWGVIRALIKNLFAGKVVQGGSTITQQLIKNRFEYRSKSWIRKINEAMTSMMLEKRWDKGRIIESYFNEIYWGQSGKLAIRGVQQASNYYFSKQPTQLKIHEQALLIAIVKGPSWYSPISQKERATQRRNLVLKIWFETGVINQNQYNSAKNQDVVVKRNTQFANRKYGDFLDLVKSKLKKMYSNDELYQQGLKIFTTLDPFISDQLNSSITPASRFLGENLQAASVIVDPKNGHLLALKGSADKTTFFNRALYSKRQIGSLIKPFVFLAGLAELDDFDMSSLVDDSHVKLQTQNGNLWSPKNYDSKSMGQITANQALYLSRNQATVNLGLEIGVRSFIKFLSSIGLKINHSNHPSIFLGSTELTPMEVAHLYLIIASSTQFNSIQTILHVTDYENNIISETQNTNLIRLNTNDLEQVQRSLNNAITQGTGRSLSDFNQPNHQIFGKTGTTNDGRNSWFVGYDSNYLGVFWLGKDDNSATSLTGASGALKLWKAWYQNIYY